MTGAGAKMEVAKVTKGVAVTFASDDPKVVARVQKMAEEMRLMFEANAEWRSCVRNRAGARVGGAPA
jgi:hypothetical protein